MDANVMLRKALETLRDSRRSLGGEAPPTVKGELAVIQAALDRIAAGAYGTCVACGRGIAPERLAFLPATPHCLGCAAEIAHAQGSRPPTVPTGPFRGEHLGILTDMELGDLLTPLVRRSGRGRAPSSPADRPCPARR